MAQRAEVFQLLGLLQKLVSQFSIERTEAGVKSGLTHQQFLLLGSMIQTPGCTVGHVAEQHFLAQPAVSRSLKGLVARRLVTRKRDAKDQRVVRLNATRAGFEVLSVLHAEAESSVGILMSRLSTAERKGLFLGLSAFVRELGQLESITQPKEKHHE